MPRRFASGIAFTTMFSCWFRFPWHLRNSCHSVRIAKSQCNQEQFYLLCHCPSFEEFQYKLFQCACPWYVCPLVEQLCTYFMVSLFDKYLERTTSVLQLFYIIFLFREFLLYSSLSLQRNFNCNIFTSPFWSSLTTPSWLSIDNKLPVESRSSPKNRGKIK